MKWLTFILLFTMSAFALGETLLRSAARRRLDALTLTVTAPTGAGAVRMTGPWWSWDPNGGPEAIDNYDGTWSVTFDPVPTENMQYLWVVDNVQESLFDNAGNGECTAKIDGGSLITDYWSWANRVWVLGSGDAADTYDSCAGTSTGGGNGDDIETGDVEGCTYDAATNYDSAATVQAVDMYGNLECVFLSCDDIPDAEGCIYADSYSAFGEFFSASDCSIYSGTPCTTAVFGCTTAAPLLLFTTVTATV